jgi:hypothetical protein
VTERFPAPPSKSGNLSLLTEGRKDLICTTTRTLEGATFPAYQSLRKLLEFQEKKTQNPKHRDTGIKILTKNNSRCINLNT